MILKTSEYTYYHNIKNSIFNLSTPVIIVFCVRWDPKSEDCLRQLSEAFPTVNIYKMDTFENQTLIKELSIKEIPTVVLFQNGKAVSQFAYPFEIKEIRKSYIQLKKGA